MQSIDNLGLPFDLASSCAIRSRLWPEVRTEIGPLEFDWITAEAFFNDDAAIEEYLGYESSFHGGVDRKTCAASTMIDISYVFASATVPLFVRFGIVPDLAPCSYALKFHLVPQEHDNRVFQVRRAHVRFLSAKFSSDRRDASVRADHVASHDQLCDLYRRGIEDHMRPLVRTLFRKTGLPRNALWRLVADAVAGRFLEVGRHFDCLESAKGSASAILKRHGSPLCNRQLHFFDLALRDETDRELLRWTFRSRGGCCRYYMVEPGELCETCVLQKPQERDAKLLQAMRENYWLLQRGSAGARSVGR